MSKGRVVFITGHLDLTLKEFNLHYKPQIDQALLKRQVFVVGDARGADFWAQDYLFQNNAECTVYHMLELPRNNPYGYSSKGGYKSDDERDLAMHEAADLTIGWVRPGREKSGTAKNLRRRQETLHLEKMKKLNELSKLHYNWLEEMKWNTSTYLEASGMILSEMGEAALECEPLNSQRLKEELADVFLRSIGLGSRFSINFSEVLAKHQDLWRDWADQHKFSTKNNLEILALMVGQGVALVNECRQSPDVEKLGKYLSLIMRSTEDLATKNGFDILEAIEVKIQHNVAKGNSKQRPK